MLAITIVTPPSSAARINPSLIILKPFCESGVTGGLSGLAVGCGPGLTGGGELGALKTGDSPVLVRAALCLCWPGPY